MDQDVGVSNVILERQVSDALFFYQDRLEGLIR
jgi:hypothetical protein